MVDELQSSYGSKVVSVDQIVRLIGPISREKKVAMCHGVFDVVHPGHIRHLAYAKSKADILLVSITCDRWITKGPYRPHVPENLRAYSLAALDLVDFIIIDKNPNPIENLKSIKPNYFAKGFEYSNNLPRETLEEMEVVVDFGGEMLFSPGDVVYSSSKLIDASSPDLGSAKLKTMMEQLNITFANVEGAIAAISGTKVHVVGDTIVDSFTRTSLIGGNTKTPTFSVRFESKENYVGGAGIVAQHLKAAGADVTFSTILGDDELGRYARDVIESSDINLNAVVEKNRPTTNKNAIICSGYRLLKIDTLDNASISREVLSKFQNYISSQNCDCVIFSDFRHGIFNKGTINELKQAIPDGSLRVADSQLASRWGNITEFVGFDLITPNEREARFALADQDCNIVQLCHMIQEKTHSSNVILKLGAKGLFFLGKDVYHSLDSFTQVAVDPVGSGDALLAYSSLVMRRTGSLALACIIGSLAAACECELDGNIPVSPETILKKLDNIKRQVF